ncbi:MAG: cysteine hydrolase [Gammaproteobacteria bacterium]|nr:MAG: cysteine hydrolase [Gammaproteobacteria bacterium]
MISIQSRGDRIYEFSPAATALLVIDFQKEFFMEGIGECLDEMRSILPRVSKLINLVRDLRCKVIHTRESYKPDLSDVNSYRKSLDYVGKSGPLGRFCIVGEPGHEFVEEVQPLPDETVIDKASFGAFYNTSLDDLLRRDGIDHIIICGITTQCCVHSTLREAVDRGYWCLTVADCCAASDFGMHDAALNLIAGEGHLFGWVTDLRDIERSISSFTNT